MPNYKIRRVTVPFLFLFCAAAGSAASGETTITWKPVETAVLKLDNRAVKTWIVYLAEKKKQLILIQLGQRYLALDTKAHTVYEFDPQTVKRKGTTVESPDLQRSWRQISSSEWATRDIGPAQLVRVKLLDYGRVLEVQLPHPYDFRVSH